LSQTQMSVSCEKGCDCPICSGVVRTSVGRASANAYIDGENGCKSAALRTNGSPSLTGNVQSMAAIALEALDCLNIGLLVTNADCRLLRANKTAQRILDGRIFVTVDAGGVLRTAKGLRTTPADVVRRVTEADGSEKHRPHVLATMREVAGNREITIVAAKPQMVSEHSALGTVLLLLFSTSQGRTTSSEALTSIFGFTSAEAMMANLVLEGLSRNDCSSYLRIQPTTVAFHLKNMFRKTRSRCHAQLISKLFKAIGLIHSASGDTTAITQGSVGKPLADIEVQLGRDLRIGSKSGHGPCCLPK